MFFFFLLTLKLINSSIIYIPYFASQPNGGWFVVEDRGGAIQGNRIDVYMNSHSEALAWGVRYLDVEVLN